ncbi:hypothetical protein ACO2Q9_00955 [Variovorax sp. VNK109]|jgi:hypothetical protein|uniref:hypothetical protein n=1 Tax=Variovorax sp. VNK109 TaxID=3400919 RepID=UPI003C0FF997
MSHAPAPAQTPPWAVEAHGLLSECGSEGLNQLYGALEEIAHARGLLGGSLTQLRDDMKELMADGSPELQARLAEAFVALQAEDAVAQMLDHVHHRAAALGQGLARLNGHANQLFAARTFGGVEPEQWPRLREDLQACAQELRDLERMRAPVGRHASSPGPIDLF